MGLSSGFKKLIGIEEEDFDYTEEELEKAKEDLRKEEAKELKPKTTYFQPKEEPVKATPQQTISRTLTGTQQVVLIDPKSFDECPKLVDSLKGRRPVIINLEKIETETARKIFDFLSGATYALNGTVQKIANNIFIFAPENVSINQTEERSFEYGAQKSPWR